MKNQKVSGNLQGKNSPPRGWDPHELMHNAPQISIKYKVYDEIKEKIKHHSQVNVNVYGLTKDPIVSIFPKFIAWMEVKNSKKSQYMDGCMIMENRKHHHYISCFC